LVVGVTLQKEDIDDRQLVDESVTLELLPNAGADGGHGLRDRVHGLDLGRLINNSISIAFRMRHCAPRRCSIVVPPGSNRDMPQAPAAWRRTNWPLLPVSSWFSEEKFFQKLTLPRRDGELGR
jgi:hypothetical protein